MKYVVTGGAGFIGSHIAKSLLDEKHAVTIVDNLNTGKIENIKEFQKEINFVKGDIRDETLLKKILKDVDGVFHEAALASVQESFYKVKEYNYVNVRGTENIFKCAYDYNFKVVYASSSSVYGNPLKIPIQENDPKNPINPYAQTKLDCEHLAKNYQDKGVSIIGLRYFNVFGEGQSETYAGVIKKFLKRAQNNEPLIINGSGKQTRDFVYVGDVANANILSMKSKISHEFFNIGSGSTISVLELANLIIDAFGLTIKPIHGPELSGDVQTTKADISHARKMLNWQPKIEIREWLNFVIKERKNLDTITN